MQAQAIDLTGDLKRVVGPILVRYRVPMDDQSLIFEKIDNSVSSLTNAFAKVHGDLKSDMDGKLADAVRRMASKAYKMKEDSFQKGLAQGEEKSKSQGPGTLTIVMTIGLLALAGFVIVDHVFLRKS